MNKCLNIEKYLGLYEAISHNQEKFEFFLNCGGNANDGTKCGAFKFNVNNAPSNSNWNNGCGLSYGKLIYIN